MKTGTLRQAHDRRIVMDNTGKKNRLIQILKSLTRAEKLIVVLYHYEELTMAEIAKVLELSESKVKQMYTSLIREITIKMAND